MQIDYRPHLRHDDRDLLMEFFHESIDQIKGLEDHILSLENNSEIDQLIISIREPIAHIQRLSIFFKLSLLETLSAQMLKLLTIIQSQKNTINPEHIDCQIASVEHIRQTIQTLRVHLENPDNTDKNIDVPLEENDYKDVLTWLDDLNQGQLTQIKGKSNLTQELDMPPQSTHDDNQLHPSPTIQALDNQTEMIVDTTQKTQINAAQPPQPITNPMPDIIDSNFKFMPQMVQDFVSEAQDYIVSAETSLLNIEANPDAESDNIDTILRGFHSLKGNAGLLISMIKDETIRRKHIINKIRTLTHAAETLVQIKRDRHGSLSSDVDLLLKVCDENKWLINDFNKGDQWGRNIFPLLELCIKTSGESEKNLETKKVMSDEILSQSKNPHKTSALIKTIQQLIESLSAGIQEIQIQDKRKTARGKIKRALQTLNRVGHSSDIPEFKQLTDDATDALDRLSGEWTQNIASSYLPIISIVPKRLQLFIDDKSNAMSKAQPGSSNDISDKKGLKLLKTNRDQISSSDIQSAMVKVPQDRLDHLMNLIGELIVRKNGLLLLARSIVIDDNRPDIGAKVKDASSAIGRISDELQASIMGIRMMPVSHVFNRFPRLVRDLSKELNKQIQLKLEGGETELDKTVIEAIGTPLVHLIRNAVDHGIELPQHRENTGKNRIGVIILKAYNEGNNVLIEITDDGKGIDPGKIGAIAVKRGLIDMESLEQMTEEQVKHLIFEPGFSSAEQVTDVSGRGVGMDVVRKEIEAIGGTVHLQSTLSQGTTMSLRLPLTLAVSQGLKVSVGKEFYYIPLEYISETVKINKSAFHTHQNIQIVLYRNKIFVAKNLSTILNIPSGLNSDQHLQDDICSIVILDVMGEKSALIVDQFYREEEYVIKPIHGAFEHLQEFMGATITSEGKVILVLNPLKI